MDCRLIINRYKYFIIVASGFLFEDRCSVVGIFMVKLWEVKHAVNSLFVDPFMCFSVFFIFDGSCALGFNHILAMMLLWLISCLSAIGLF